jgi:hypothetical protein
LAGKGDRCHFSAKVGFGQDLGSSQFTALFQLGSLALKRDNNFSGTENC